MNKFIDIISLIRVRQWYKNLLIFLPLIFIGNLFNLSQLWQITVGFFSLCMISSANYVINDLIDIKKDQHHPEKKHRPLASGKIHKTFAVILAIILFLGGIAVALTQGTTFTVVVFLLLAIDIAYSFFLKNILFADIITISVLFVIRAISGAYILHSYPSPWLILCPFFLSLFLVVGKRHADLMLLKTGAEKTRKVLKEYSPAITNHLMIISTTSLILSYALYSFLSIHKNLIFTVPFALFAVLRYYFLIDSGSPIARHPEMAVTDIYLVIGGLLWAISVFVVLYLSMF